MRKITAWVILALTSWWAASPSTSHEIKLGKLIIVHPWARPLPDTPEVLGGYLKIINKGQEDDKLVSATAEIAGSARFDNMNMENGVMKASVVEGGIVIPAGKTVMLNSKSLHIMFLRVKSQPTEGSEFKGTLTFEKAGTIAVDFEVEAMASH